MSCRCPLQSYVAPPMPASFEEAMRSPPGDLVAVQCVLDRDGRYHDVAPPWDAPEEKWEAWERGERPYGARYWPGHECQFSIVGFAVDG